MMGQAAGLVQFYPGTCNYDGPGAAALALPLLALPWLSQTMLKRCRLCRSYTQLQSHPHHLRRMGLRKQRKRDARPFAGCCCPLF
jgi:hypothetical protein